MTMAAQESAALANAVRAELSVLSTAGEPGAAAAHAFLGAEGDESAAGAAALCGFDVDGGLLGSHELPADAYNDFYKLSMLPVIRAVEREAGGDVRVVFALNVRTAAARLELATDAACRGALYARLCAALGDLARRRFDRAALTSAAVGLERLEPGIIDKLCAQPLADRVLIGSEATDDWLGDAERPPPAPGAVVVRVAFEPSANRLHVEAEGPWHRVTFLETPLLQAVHETFLRHRLARDGTPYAAWLARALCRCARSVDAANSSGLRVALFAGRRCGGLAWLLVQNAYCAAHLTSPLGTSSITASAWLERRGVRALQLAGTHAHELSLVLDALYGAELDETLFGGAPVGSVLGHVLYLALSRPAGDATGASRAALMPALPDTLTSSAFFAAARALRVPSATASPSAAAHWFHPTHRGAPLLDALGGARQDSGGIGAFKTLCDAACGARADRSRPFELMASEISHASDLEEARAHGYASIAAGGFFGDSQKAWPAEAGTDAGASRGDAPPSPNSLSVSLAAKPIAVFVGDTRTRVQPIKLGDADATRDVAASQAAMAHAEPGKLTVDARLAPTEHANAVARAWRIAGCAERAASGEAAGDETVAQAKFEAVLSRILGTQPPAPRMNEVDRGGSGAVGS
jgi:hypothetical protein